MIATLMRAYPGLTPGEWLNTPTVWIEALTSYIPAFEAGDRINLALGTHGNQDQFARWQRQVRELRDTSAPAGRGHGIPSKRAAAIEARMAGFKVEID